MKTVTVILTLAFVGCASAQPVPTRPATTNPESYNALPPPPPPIAPDILPKAPSQEPKYFEACGVRYPEDRNEIWGEKRPCWEYPKYYRHMLYIHVVLSYVGQSRTEDLQRFFCKGELESVKAPRGWQWNYDYLLEQLLLVGNPLKGVESVKADLRMLGKAAYCGQNIDRRFADKLTRYAEKFGQVEDPGLIWKVNP